MKALGLLWAALVGLAACGGSTAAVPSRPSPTPTQIGHITIAGAERTYVLYRPRSLDPTKLAPLVITLHGYSQGTTGIQAMTNFNDLAQKVGFVVAYPQGIASSWNAGSCCGQNDNDDVAFIKALIDRLVTIVHVDPKRVFATGMSNGAAMAHRLGCEASDRIAAVASVSGSLITKSCNPSRAISVLEMHGVADPIVPYQGGEVSGLGSFPPTISVMKRWASLDGCAPEPAVSQSAITTTYTWTQCRDGSRVVLEAIAGAGHRWFGQAGYNEEPDATQVVWTFFSQSPPLP